MTVVPVRRLRAAVLLAVVGVLLTGVLAAPAVGAETPEPDGPLVEVGAEGESRYSPAEVTVEPGEEVTFLWVSGSHSVTHDADDPVFDTHPDCREGSVLGVPRDCGEVGSSEEIALDEPGTYAYRCRLHDDMRGRITVEEPAHESDDAEESGESGESGDATDGDAVDGDDGSAESGQQTPSEPDDTAGDSDEASGGSGAAAGQSGQEDRSDEEDAERRAAADALGDFSPGDRGQRDAGGSPVPAEGMEEPEPAGGAGGIEEPEVDDPDDERPGAGDPDPDLEPFPEAQEPGADGEVALPAQGGQDRTVPIAIATVGVLGAGAAVVRQVMVGV